MQRPRFWLFKSKTCCARHSSSKLGSALTCWVFERKRMQRSDYFLNYQTFHALFFIFNTNFFLLLTNINWQPIYTYYILRPNFRKLSKEVGSKEVRSKEAFPSWGRGVSIVQTNRHHQAGMSFLTVGFSTPKLSDETLKVPAFPFAISLMGTLTQKKSNVKSVNIC